jgi:four helix bundle protein
MSAQKNDLKQRTKLFSICIIRFCNSLPGSVTNDIITKQLIRSSTSVGANYRASQRSKSKKDFLNKIVIVEEECDETCYWLELLDDLHPNRKAEIQKLWKEGNELTAIFTTIAKKTKESLNIK